jgi:hypothetical protein
MEGLGPKDESEGAKGGRGVIGPEKAAGGTREGATEVMEGMAVGGKSCCPITVRGERHGSLASRSGVTNLSSHNYYCRQLFISRLLSPRLSLSRPRPETQGDGENPPALFHFEIL